MSDDLDTALQRMRRRALTGLLAAYLVGLVTGHLLDTWLSVIIQLVVVPPLVLLLARR